MFRQFTKNVLIAKVGLPTVLPVAPSSTNVPVVQLLYQFQRSLNFSASRELQAGLQRPGIVHRSLINTSTPRLFYHTRRFLSTTTSSEKELAVARALLEETGKRESLHQEHLNVLQDKPHEAELKAAVSSCQIYTSPELNCLLKLEEILSIGWYFPLERHKSSIGEDNWSKLILTLKDTKKISAQEQAIQKLKLVLLPLLQPNGWDLCLMSALPQDKQPVAGKVYLEKQGDKLKYVVNSPTHERIEATLDICIEGDLTKELLNSKKSEILNITSDRGHTQPNHPSLAIVAVPSSTKGNLQHGVTKLARQIAAELNITDATACLERTMSIPKAATGGRRDKDIHQKTITVNAMEKLAGKNILLLDDVVTTGNSIAVCRSKLLDKGAKFVSSMVLGRTYSVKLHTNYEATPAQQQLNKLANVDIPEINQNHNSFKILSNSSNNTQSTQSTAHSKRKSP